MPFAVPFWHRGGTFVTSDLVLQFVSCLLSAMICQSQFRLRITLLLLILASPASAAPKPHIVSFGKWTTVQYSPNNSADEQPLTMKVRPLLLDTRIKEFTFGPAHDLTERLFVVRRAFRVNDSLPQEPALHWQWQPGGWLLVDRTTGHISPLNLPEFDAFTSTASWYRDYVAYCGASDDGKKIYAIVAQLNRRKPVLKKLLGEKTADAEIKSLSADPACPAPVWQRTPARVTFEFTNTLKQTFAIRGHAVDIVTESEGEENEEASK